MRRICRTLFAAILLAGCATSRKPDTPRVQRHSERDALHDADDGLKADQLGSSDYDSPTGRSIQLTGFQNSSDLLVAEDESLITDTELQSAAPGNAMDAEPHAVQFDEVVSSVYRSYPLLESALLSRNIALGMQVGARGAFDTKLKGISENGPQGFYHTYRQSIGVVQPTYWGGEVYAGYRVGRGEFQPWYQERQTNDGGEFKAGVQIPLARNRDID